MRTQPAALVTPSLFDPPAPDPETIEGRFELFHQEWPEVYQTLLNLAREKRRQGHTHYGIKALYETTRVLLDVPPGEQAPRLNNDFTALYSRKLMAENAELAGFFRTRARREKKARHAQAA